MTTTKATPPPNWYLDLWPTFDALLGPNASSALRNIAGAEAEVGAWLTAKGRQSTEWLQPKDLADVLHYTSDAILSARFAVALWLARQQAAHPPVSVDGKTGEILVTSDRPLAETPPRLVTVSQSERQRPDPLDEILKRLAAVKVRIRPEVRARAWDLTMSTGKVRVHSRGALAKMADRERKRAKDAGLHVTPGERGRPKK